MPAAALARCAHTNAAVSPSGTLSVTRGPQMAQGDRQGSAREVQGQM